MRPTLLPGDRLLVDPGAFRRSAPRVGEVVLARDPQRPERRLLKRVAAVGGGRRPDGGEMPPGSVFLLGDDLERSRDSRTFGPVPVGELLGKVWHRYLPPQRRGPIEVGDATDHPPSS
jgi:Signal peptidase, peptidase S26